MSLPARCGTCGFAPWDPPQALPIRTWERRGRILGQISGGLFVAGLGYGQHSFMPALLLAAVFVSIAAGLFFREVFGMIAESVNAYLYRKDHGG